MDFEVTPPTMYNELRYGYVRINDNNYINKILRRQKSLRIFLRFNYDFYRLRRMSILILIYLFLLCDGSSPLPGSSDVCKRITR